MVRVILAKSKFYGISLNSIIIRGNRNCDNILVNKPDSCYSNLNIAIFSSKLSAVTFALYREKGVSFNFTEELY